jgi:hypothetical protein
LIPSSSSFNINSSIFLCSDSERRGAKSESEHREIEESEDSKSFSKESSVNDYDTDDEDEVKEDEVDEADVAENFTSFMALTSERIIPKLSVWIGLFADDKGWELFKTLSVSKIRMLSSIELKSLLFLRISELKFSLWVKFGI